MLELLREGDSEPATLECGARAFAGLLEAPEELAGHLGAGAGGGRGAAARCSRVRARSSGRRSSVR